MQLDLDFHGTSTPSEPKIHTVTELTRRVRDLIERGVGEVWVEGEISNYRRQASGHQYFTLKDAFCQLPCVLFSGAAAALHAVKLADGQRVQAFGMLSVYEPRGQYQMIVRLIQTHGQGMLQAKFEALKQKLAAEGLFDARRKRPLPRFPKRVGLVTSPTGAAIRDFLKVLHRRHPGIEVLISPVRVQGRGAAAEIARAIRDFGQWDKIGLPQVDVIVVTRGGGSIEDLWEFNEEIVARAIAASPIPLLSAIGHEIDFTIADFAADLRAATPSAAAEILAAERTEVVARLRQDLLRLTQACMSKLELLAARLNTSQRSSLFREPARRVLELAQTLDRSVDAVGKCAALRLEREKYRFDRLASRLFGQLPVRAIKESRFRCQMLAQRITETAARELTARRARLERAAGILNALDPRATLMRGYTITMDAEGGPLTFAREIEAGMLLRTQFQDGEAHSIAAKR
ncbi:MAG TPA: exodeoxyribonuclease VII large subunit [Terrimicrobiaceae bacterium]